MLLPQKRTGNPLDLEGIKVPRAYISEPSMRTPRTDTVKACLEDRRLSARRSLYDKPQERDSRLGANAMTWDEAGGGGGDDAEQGH